MNHTDILRASLLLFAMIDVIGTLPYILLVQKREGSLLPLQTSLTAGLIMFVFLISGEYVFSMFGISVHSFALAGSIIILASGIELTFGKSLYSEDPGVKGVSSIVPIAFPMLAGAGTITTILSLKNEMASIDLSIAILLNVGFIYLTIKSSRFIEGKLSPANFILIRKFFGIIVLSMGIQMLYTHIQHLL